MRGLFYVWMQLFISSLFFSFSGNVSIFQLNFTPQNKYARSASHLTASSPFQKIAVPNIFYYFWTSKLLRLWNCSVRADWEWLALLGDVETMRCKDQCVSGKETKQKQKNERVHWITIYNFRQENSIWWTNSCITLPCCVDSGNMFFFGIFFTLWHPQNERFSFYIHWITDRRLETARSTLSHFWGAGQCFGHAEPIFSLLNYCLEIGSDIPKTTEIFVKYFFEMVGRIISCCKRMPFFRFFLGGRGAPFTFFLMGKQLPE